MKQCKALSNDRYEKIRKALAMGPTPGPWVAGKNNMAVNFRFVTDRSGDIVAYCDKPKGEALANACLISACDPDTIQALLEERDALREALIDIKALADTGGWYSNQAGSVAEKALAGEGGF